jgi:hypothetical protein
MKSEIVKKHAPGRTEVEILGATYDDGKPNGEDMGKWRQKLATRDDKIKYLQTGERYFYGPPEGGFGSEKRKNPA